MVSDRCRGRIAAKQEKRLTIKRRNITNSIAHIPTIVDDCYLPEDPQLLDCQSISAGWR